MKGVTEGKKYTKEFYKTTKRNRQRKNVWEKRVRKYGKKILTKG